MGTSWPLILICTLLPIFLLLLALELFYVLCYRHRFLRRCKPPPLGFERSILPPGSVPDPRSPLTTPSPSKELTLYYLFMHGQEAVAPTAPPAMTSSAAEEVVLQVEREVVEEVCFPPPPPWDARESDGAEDEEVDDDDDEKMSAGYFTPPDSSPVAAASNLHSYRAGARAGAGAGVFAV